ncbi:MAG: hypothetical protein QOG15_3691 [Solirubrobacteraceae bacterium]|nr:hypothetical protein [Solirubrobacteraceae bacterium]
MTSLRELVDSPTLTPLLAYLVRPRSDRGVAQVALIEDLAEIERVEPATLVLLTHAASAAASSYRFDMALRVARTRQIAGIVLSAVVAENVTPTSAAIANRSGTAILATGRDVDLAQLAVAIGRELAGDADSALLRAHTALRALQAHPHDVPKGFVSRAQAALGVEMRMVDQEPASAQRAPILVDDNVEGWISAEPQDGDMGLGVDIVVHAAAAEIARAMTSSRRAEELPIQTLEQALNELMSARPEDSDRLVQRARRLGVPIDGWHVAVRLEFEELADRRSSDESAVEVGRRRVAGDVLRSLDADGTWYTARAGGALVLLRMFDEDPGVSAPGAIARTIDTALGQMRRQLPTTLLRCGVGTPHRGPDGLQASLAEAKAAVTLARTSARANRAVPFDSVGLRRTLVEWYTSDTAQEAVTTVLAPLTELGAARGERLIQTLHVYLDQRCSLTRTARVMSLHRNAVSYRVKQAFELLDIDPENADDMLLLQLACRARELV